MLLLQGRISPHQNMTLCVIGRVRFERNYGKMYSRHLFPYGGLLTDATVTRTSLKKRICLLSVYIAIIPTHLLCQMKANPHEVEFQGTMYKFRKRKKIPSLLVYALHKTRNLVGAWDEDNGIFINQSFFFKNTYFRYLIIPFPNQHNSTICIIFTKSTQS